MKEVVKQSNLIMVIDQERLIKTEGEGSELMVKKLGSKVTWSRSSIFKYLIKTKEEGPGLKVKELGKQSNLIKVIDHQMSHQD